MGGTCCCFRQQSLAEKLNAIALFEIIATSISIPVTIYLAVSGLMSKDLDTTTVTVYFVVIVLELGYLILCSLLMHGIRNSSPRLCKPWLICNYITVTLGGVATLTYACICILMWTRPTEAFLKLGIGATMIVVEMCTVCTVQRFVDELKTVGYKPLDLHPQPNNGIT